MAGIAIETEDGAPCEGPLPDAMEPFTEQEAVCRLRVSSPVGLAVT